MVMYGDDMIISLKKKEKKIWTNDKIEPQHVHAWNIYPCTKYPHESQVIKFIGL